MLRLCAKAIETDFAEKVIDETELIKIKSEIDEIYEDISNADIDKELKIVLLDLLKAMYEAIHEYRIRGINSFKDSIALIIGKVVMNNDLIKNNQSEETTKVTKIVNKFIAIYSFAADTVQLLGASEILTKLLGR